MLSRGRCHWQAATAAAENNVPDDESVENDISGFKCVKIDGTLFISLKNNVAQLENNPFYVRDTEEEDSND